MQPCYWSIEELPGLSKKQQAQLKTIGITTTKQLLQKASTAELKQAIANELKIKIQYVKKWVALADLARIPEVGVRYCGLLLHSGIISVSQLTQTPAHRLHQQILRMQVSTMQRRDLCPSIGEVQKWIEQAKSI